MAVANRKAPKEKKAPKSKAAPAPEEQNEGAWKYGENGKERQGRKLPFESKLNEFLTGVAGGLRFVAGDEFAANAILAKREEISYGYARLAQENPQVKRALEFLFSGSAMAEALLPTASLLVMLGWHYGLFIPDKIGVPMSLANGVVPMSREGEIENARRESEAEAEREARAGDDSANGSGN